MAKLTESKFTITGKSGNVYEFNIYDMETIYNNVGGIYIFTKRTINNNNFSHDLIYCGKTDDLSTRFNNHHKVGCIKKNEANCICVKKVTSEEERTYIEEDILQGNNFKCNEVLN